MSSCRRALTGSLVALCALTGAGLASAAPVLRAPVVPLAREASPVVLTGAQLPAWSRTAATGVAEPYPSGSNQGGDSRRTAHNGTLVVPPDARTGVPVDEVAAYAWGAGGWTQVPVQVDERFPHFLANGRSDFSFYSGTDQELTYAWAPDAHSTGEEAWKKVFGACEARYADPATLAADIAQATKDGVYTPGPQETPEDYTRAMADPVPGLDDDDEIALQARDAGPMAPPGTPAPAGASGGQTVAVADPLDPAGTRYVYLFRQKGGSRFTARDADVQMVRAQDADRWIDRRSFADSDPQKIGTSNTGYGANLPGTVCDTDPVTGAVTARPSTDRFPSDAMTVKTPTYRLSASGRWMVREFAVRRPAKAGTPGTGDGQYGEDLVDRWKGRAFQQSPDSSISVVGFEDEQVNWEANASLLGWRQGPVRAIREVWGADSGTNVTKTETYYRDADVYRYRVRVHPIPSDGLYTSWDYNERSAGTYYNLLHPEGVPIDGANDDTGSIDQIPVTGQPAYFDAADPTFDLPSAIDRPEQVAGKGGNGSLVYVFEFKGATSATNATAVPYYRDDRCLDDGTGDDPVQRPWPGEASTDDRVLKGYAALAGKDVSALTCDDKQGAYASHGIHFFATHDSDNATVGVPLTEVDGQQWRYSVPMDAPRNVLAQYAPNVVTPLQTAVTPFS
ncbi:MAG: S-layer y protein [Frankiales bacterium]|nr:S-layer y protein [Frankiales bacterium]